MQMKDIKDDIEFVLDKTNKLYENTLLEQRK